MFGASTRKSLYSCILAMGSSVSKRLKENECTRNAGQSTFSMLYFGSSRTLYALEFPSEITKGITKVLKHSWKHGVSEFSDGAALAYWKLEKFPWVGTGSRAIEARRVVRDIIGLIFSHGYVLDANMRICRRNDSDCLCFRAPETIAPSTTEPTALQRMQQMIERGTLGPLRPGNPPSLGILCLHGTDKVRVADMDTKSIDIIHDLLEQCWHKGVQHAETILPGCVEFKLHGNPWVSSGVDSATTRGLLARLLSSLKDNGYHPVSSITLSIFNDHASTFLLLRDFEVNKAVSPQGGAPGVEAGAMKPTDSPGPLESTAAASDVKAQVALDLPCLSLNNFNKIRVGGFSPTVRKRLHNVIEGSWTPGLHHAGPLGNMYEWELKGSPWYPGGRDIEGVGLLCELLREIRLSGLRLLCSADVSQRIGGLDTLYFEEDTGTRLSPGTNVLTCAIFPHSKQRLTVVNGLVEVKNAINYAIERHWSKGLKSHTRGGKHYHIANVEDYALKGGPWVAHSGSTAGVQVRRMIMSLIEQMEAHGWNVLACVDVSRSADKYALMDVDCLFFEKVERPLFSPASPVEEWSSSSVFKPPPIAIPPPKRSVAVYNQRYASHHSKYMKSPTARIGV